MLHFFPPVTESAPFIQEESVRGVPRNFKESVDLKVHTYIIAHDSYCKTPIVAQLQVQCLLIFQCNGKGQTMWSFLARTSFY